MLSDSTPEPAWKPFPRKAVGGGQCESARSVVEERSSGARELWKTSCRETPLWAASGTTRTCFGTTPQPRHNTTARSQHRSQVTTRQPSHNTTAPPAGRPCSGQPLAPPGPASSQHHSQVTTPTAKSKPTAKSQHRSQVTRVTEVVTRELTWAAPPEPFPVLAEKARISPPRGTTDSSGIYCRVGGRSFQDHQAV